MIGHPARQRVEEFQRIGEPVGAFFVAGRVGRRRRHRRPVHVQGCAPPLDRAAEHCLHHVVGVGSSRGKPGHGGRAFGEIAVKRGFQQRDADYGAVPGAGALIEPLRKITFCDGGLNIDGGLEFAECGIDGAGGRVFDHCAVRALAKPRR